MSRAWTSEAVGGGPIASPVLSADGTTAYVNGRDGRLWAVDTADGTEKWSVDSGYQPQTPPSVSAEGVIVAGGGPGAQLTGVTDTGEIVWARADVEPLSTSSRAGEDIGYTVVRDGEQGQALLVFDPVEGGTVNRYPLPEATGRSVGVSIDRDGRVVAATGDGQVYGFAPA